MLVSTLAIVFSPNMVRCNDTENPMTFLTLQKRAQIVLTQLASLRKQKLITNDKKVAYLFFNLVIYLYTFFLCLFFFLNDYLCLQLLPFYVLLCIV